MATILFKLDILFLSQHSNNSSMRRSVSPPDKTSRRELKIRRARGILNALGGVSSGDETLYRMLYITFRQTGKTILAGEIKAEKLSVSLSESDSQTLVKN